ncbi:hypothetical protein L2E80_16040 [Planktothrix agardhii 1812]|jgi:hypothetical protein|uniref:Uncharacterized protein n=2 Tax=Planktothrix agardhii TaxID=1160 RepID=A0A1J1JLS2_PLAAG|nr:hypothetical protein [Planktothrix agardhii]MCF3576755.1 hypothetical protein [Planktothrix agardhii 1812]CUM61204.1 conserved protein of unknown function [Planktothrix agardhii]
MIAMKSQQMITFFSEIVTQKPELFSAEVLNDLTRLEAVLDNSETESNSDRIESISEAIIEFCDVNPQINSKLTEMGSEPEFNAAQNLEENQIQTLSNSVKKVLDLHFLNRSNV